MFPGDRAYAPRGPRNARLLRTAGDDRRALARALHRRGAPVHGHAGSRRRGRARRLRRAVGDHHARRARTGRAPLWPRRTPPRARLGGGARATHPVGRPRAEHVGGRQPRGAHRRGGRRGKRADVGAAGRAGAHRGLRRGARDRRLRLRPAGRRARPVLALRTCRRRAAAHPALRRAGADDVDGARRHQRVDSLERLRSGGARLRGQRARPASAARGTRDRRDHVHERRGLGAPRTARVRRGARSRRPRASRSLRPRARVGARARTDRGRGRAARAIRARHRALALDRARARSALATRGPARGGGPRRPGARGARGRAHLVAARRDRARCGRHGHSRRPPRARRDPLGDSRSAAHRSVAPRDGAAPSPAGWLCARPGDPPWDRSLEGGRT